MKLNKLRARWSKSEKDILVNYPLGQGTSCDCNYLLGDIFNRQFVNEITSRGYDIKTFKFEITVNPKGKRFAEKFPTLYKESLENKVKE